MTARSIRPSPSRSPQATPIPAWYPPAGVGRDAGGLTDLLEAKAPQVVEQEIRRGVIGDEQVDEAVAVEVGGDDPQPAAVAVDDAGLGCHVDEPARVVAEDVVRQGGDRAGIAGDVDPAGRVLADPRIAADPRRRSGRRTGRGLRRCPDRRTPTTSASRGRPPARPLAVTSSNVPSPWLRYRAYDRHRVTKMSGWPSLS